MSDGYISKINYFEYFYEVDFIKNVNNNCIRVS